MPHCKIGLYGAFPPAATGRFGMQRCGKKVNSLPFHRQKWMGFGLSRDEPYSSRSTPQLGYWDVWKGVNKFELHTPSVDWSTERGIITNKHSTRKVFMENSKSFVYWRKCHAKVWRPSWTPSVPMLIGAYFKFSVRASTCMGQAHKSKPRRLRLQS